MTPNDEMVAMISETGSLVDLPLSQENRTGFSNTMTLGSESQYTAQSFNFPSSIFKSQHEFSLYEQFNKGEKKNPLGPLYKVKPLDEEN